MTARIYKSFNLLAGLHFNSKFYTNSYTIDLTFNVEAESILDQNIALERVEFMIKECFYSTVFVNQTETDAIQKYINAGMTVCTLPEDPYDQVIGIMLMVKLNAITEGRLVITDISIESNMSDGVSCLYSLEEPLGPFMLKGWWTDSSYCITDEVKSKKIVKLSKTKNDWADVQLSWAKTDTNKTAEIIFTNFDKTDK